MSETLCFPVGKLDRCLLTAASQAADPSHLFYIADSISNRRFLVDTGAAVSIVPVTAADRRLRTADTQSFVAANGSRISAFGHRDLTVRFNGVAYKWSFAIANIKFCIIGSDFLRHNDLLVDVNGRRLLPASTVLQPPVTAVTPTLPPQLVDFPDLLTPSFDEVAAAKHNVEHHIVTAGPPPHARARRLAPDKLAAAKAEFSHMEALGVVRRSDSPFASPLHMVRKADGSWRPCGDFRRLNAATTPDRYPLPHLMDFSAKLHGCRYFSKIDLYKGFYHIPVAADSIAKTAVITPFGLYEFLRMPFGLCNAAQTFQRFMDQVVADMDDVFVYVDDVLVSTKTAEQHDRVLRTLFSRFRKHGLAINAGKCVFASSAITFLGHAVDEKGLRPLPDRVAALADFPQPAKIEQLQEFLGLLNYYRRFVPHAADLLHPLTSLLKKSAGEFSFGPPAQQAFVSAKQALAQATLLVHHAPHAQLALSVDASAVAVGAALEQWVDNSWQPLGFFSRTLREPEKKYSAFDRELLAIYLAVQHFRHMLEGRRFVIYTDHKPLTFAMAAQTDYSPRQTRHLAFISEFSTDLRHVSGKDNGPADALSRNPVAAVQPPVAVSWDAIATAQAADRDDVAAAKSAMTALEWDTLILDSGAALLVDKSTGVPRPYVPAGLRRMVFTSVHDIAHPGSRASKIMITARYVWWRMKKDITEWARTCLDCQRAKVGRHTSPPVGQMPLPAARFQHLHVDLVGPLPMSQGFQFVFTIVDRFTRWPEVIPVSDMSAETCARALLSQWISRFGVPHNIVSDRGRQFTSKLWEKLASLLGVSLATTTAYHPQSNGMVERFHRQLKASLTARLVDSEWMAALPLILLAIRTAPKEDLKASPADLVYGSALALPAAMLEPCTAPPPATADFLSALRQQMAQLRTSPPLRHGSRAVYVPPALATAQFVFLREEGHRAGLRPPYLGPFPVLSRGERTVTISMNGHAETVSLDRVKPAHTTVDPPDEAPPALQHHDYL